MLFRGSAAARIALSPPMVVLGAKRWKRNFLRRFLGNVIFSGRTDHAVALAGRLNLPLAVWASKEPIDLAQKCLENRVALFRIEDGFIRSTGLGAELFEPFSLILDRTGIYFDPSRPSDLEDLVRKSVDLPVSKLNRAAELRREICRLAVSKYNTGRAGPLKVPPDKRIILVPGQVEDDASILRGGLEIRTNAKLLDQVRKNNPDAFMIYKPHPDVEAGLRRGALAIADAGLADIVVRGHAAPAVLDLVHEVWTMTSLLGFEALLRGKKVVTFGMPFYAGWGLTVDRGGQCARRASGPSLDGLVHAALIDYPRYNNPATGAFEDVETIVQRLVAGESSRRFWRALAVPAQRMACGLGLWQRR